MLVFLFLSLSFFLYANVCIRTQQSCNPTGILHTAIRFVSLYACTKRLACCYLIEFLEKFGQTGGEEGKEQMRAYRKPCVHRDGAQNRKGKKKDTCKTQQAEQMGEY